MPYPEETECSFKHMECVFSETNFDKFRPDMDDTLRQKLLTHFGGLIERDADAGYFTNSVRQIDFTEFKYTHKFLFRLIRFEYCEKYPLNAAFGLHLLGYLTKQEPLFYQLQCVLNLERMLPLCKNNFLKVLSPSVQSALYQLLCDIASHEEGLNWLANNDMLFIGLGSLTGSSLYVRKNAAKFITTVLTTWGNLYAIEILELNPILQTKVEQMYQELFTKLFDSETDVGQTGCLTALKEALSLEPGLQKWLQDKFQIESCLVRKLQPGKGKKEIELAVDVLSSLLDIRKEHEDQIIAFVIENEYMEFLIPFLASKLLQKSAIKDEDNSYLSLALSPLYIVVDMMEKISNSKVIDLLKKVMRNKETCNKLVISSLNAVLKLLPIIMDTEILHEVASLISKSFGCCVTPSSKSLFVAHISRYNKTMFKFFEVVTALLQPPGHEKLSIECLSSFFTTCTGVLDNMHSQYQTQYHAYKTLKILIPIKKNGEENWIASQLKEELIKVFPRKLMDPKWSVVDSTLEIIIILLQDKDEEVWIRGLCEQDIPSSVYDIWRNVFIDGYVKASAIKAFGALCEKSDIWKYFESKKNTTEENMIEILLTCTTEDADTFSRREAICVLSRWLKMDSLQTFTKFKIQIFKKIYKTSSSELDWEVKMTALGIWEWVLEKELSSLKDTLNSSEHKDDERNELIKSMLRSLCTWGCGGSLLCSLIDEDVTVHKEASRIMLELYKKLLDLGFLCFEHDELYEQRHKEAYENPAPFCEVKERIISINKKLLEEVLGTSTAEKIQQMIDESNKAANAPPEKWWDDSDVYPEFITQLCQIEMKNNFHKKVFSCDLYAANPSHLYDDIANAVEPIVDDASWSPSSEDDDDEHMTADCY